MHYRTILTARLKEDQGDDDTKNSIIYANLYNQYFFSTATIKSLVGGPIPPKDPVPPKDLVSEAIQKKTIKIDSLPSLETLQRALEDRGKNLDGIVEQNKFTVMTLPTIDRLKTLRTDLENLDGVLTAIDVKDPKGVKRAIDLAIKATRDIQWLTQELKDPNKNGSVGYGSEDSLYSSKMLRHSIEKAILVRLQRFEKAKNEYLAVAKDAAKDAARLDDLPDAEQKYRAYVELSQIFTNLFRNLHQYDSIQAKEAWKYDDPFATLATDVALPPAVGGAVAGGGAAAAALPRAEDPNYVQLLAEIYLDLFDLQNELGRNTQVTPTYARLPRKIVPPIVQVPQQAGAQGMQAEKGLVEQLLSETPQLAKVAPFDLKPFTAEEKASFDLIVGFSRAMNIKDNIDDPPVLTLFDKAGADANEKGAPFLQLDRTTSTDTMLVYRLPNPNRDAGRIASGSYYPKLTFQPKHLPDRGGQVDYTFSVASANPKVILTATLRQIAIRASDGDEENDDEVAARGIIPRSKSVAIVEAMVTAGSPVQNVDVTGFYQKIEVNGGPVTSPALSFLDNGIWPDTTEGDGVYTAKITLDPQEQRKQADYRVMIEARSNDKTSYVPTETFVKPPPPASPTTTSSTRKAKAPAPPVNVKTTPAPPKFQRATSVDFLVEGVAGTS